MVVDGGRPEVAFQGEAAAPGNMWSLHQLVHPQYVHLPLAEPMPALPFLLLEWSGLVLVPGLTLGFIGMIAGTSRRDGIVSEVGIRNIWMVRISGVVRCH